LEKRECTVFYSCSNNKHQFGTGFIINKRVRHLVTGFTAVDERISCVRIRGNFFNCSLINIYAPTKEKYEDEKETFYTFLEKTYDSCPGNDIMIILRDMSAKIGKEDILPNNWEA
jgi:exonuclease III